MTRTRGFTLVETMAAMALLGVFSTAAITLSAQMVGSYQRADGYTTDLLGGRTTLRLLSRDLRTAREVKVQEGQVVVRTTNQNITWQHADGILTRADGPHQQTVARGIAAFAVKVDGELVRVSLTLVPRASHPGAAPAVIETSVRRRPGEGRS